MTFLADVNVLVDLALDRQPWSLEAKRFFDAALVGGHKVCVAATSLPTLFYLVEKTSGASKAFEVIDRVLAAAEIVEVNRGTVLAARAMNGPDFEDNVQIACAAAASADAIITRNQADFTASPVRAVPPADGLALLPARP